MDRIGDLSIPFSIFEKIIIGLKALYKKVSKVLTFLVYPSSQSISRTHSSSKVQFQREHILNILLISGILLFSTMAVSAFITAIYHYNAGVPHTGVPPLSIFIVCLLFFGCYILSKKGKAKFASYILVNLYFLGAIFSAYQWSISIPFSLLINALIIVMSGILVGSRFAFIETLIIAASMITLNHLQITGSIPVDLSWRAEAPGRSDAIVYSVILSMIAIVSWLFNREIERAFKRAHRSELALQKEKDLLEIKVEERTKQLRQSQIEEMAHVYRFAEYGKVASGLFHDLVTPLNLVLLNLEKLNNKNQQSSLEHLSEAQVLLKRAFDGTKRMEDFVLSAREQIKNQEISEEFSLVDEIKGVIETLGNKALEKGVIIKFIYDKDIQTLGNPMRFDQMVVNLLLNAIESYEKVRKEVKEVIIKLDKKEDDIYLTIEDDGAGIPQKNLKEIFKPFFTTKSKKSGIGIGLSLSKDIVEKNLKGQIRVESHIGKGTIFTVEFPFNG